MKKNEFFFVMGFKVKKKTIMGKGAEISKR